MRSYRCFFIRDGKLIGRDHFYVKIGNEDTKEQILTTFVKQFYSGTPFIPREIMPPEEIDDHEVLAEWLGGEARRQSLYPYSTKRNEGKTGGTGAEECGTCVVAG